MRARCGGIELYGDKWNNSFYENEGTKKVRDNIYADLRGGNDTYVLAPKGRDVIHDSDSDGRLILGDVLIKDAKLSNCTSTISGQASHAVYKIENGDHDKTERLYIATRVNDAGDEDKLGKHLRISIDSAVVKSKADSNSVTLKNFDFTRGGFGISVDVSIVKNIKKAKQEVISNDPSGSNESSQIARLVDGGYVVAWSNGDRPGEENNKHDVYAVIYSKDHQQRKARFRINDELLGEQRYFSLTGLANGNWAIFWDSYEEITGEHYLYGKVYSKDGAQIKGQFRVNDFVPTYYLHPASLGHSEGDIIVAWQAYQFTKYRIRIVTKIYDIDGNEKQAEKAIDDVNEDAFYAEKPHLLELNNGRIVYAWRDNAVSGASFNSWYKIFAVSGQSLTDMMKLPNIRDDNQIITSVTNMTEGRFMLSYRLYPQGSSSSSSRLYSQVFGSSGESIKGETALTKQPASTSYVLGMDKGGFVHMFVYVDGGKAQYRISIFDKEYKQIVKENKISGVGSISPIIELEKELLIASQDTSKVYVTRYYSNDFSVSSTSIRSKTTCILLGSENADRIEIGNDLPIYGREGADVFVVGEGVKGNIRDFNTKEDKIETVQNEGRRRYLREILKAAREKRELQNKRVKVSVSERTESEAEVNIRQEGENSSTIILANRHAADISSDLFVVPVGSDFEFGNQASGIGIFGFNDVQSYEEDREVTLDGFLIGGTIEGDLSVKASLQDVESGAIFLPFISSQEQPGYQFETDGSYILTAGDANVIKDLWRSVRFLPSPDNDESVMLDFNISDALSGREIAMRLNAIAQDDAPRLDEILNSYDLTPDQSFNFAIGNISDVDTDINLFRPEILYTPVGSGNNLYRYFNLYSDGFGYVYANGTASSFSGDADYKYLYAACINNICSDQREIDVHFKAALDDDNLVGRTRGNGREQNIGALEATLISFAVVAAAGIASYVIYRFLYNRSASKNEECEAAGQQLEIVDLEGEQREQGHVALASEEEMLGDDIDAASQNVQDLTSDGDWYVETLRSAVGSVWQLADNMTGGVPTAIHSFSAYLYQQINSQLQTNADNQEIAV